MISSLWWTWNGFLKLGKGIETAENQGKIRKYLDYRIVEIGQNTKKSPGDLQRLTVNQTPVTTPDNARIEKNPARIKMFFISLCNRDEEAITLFFIKI